MFGINYKNIVEKVRRNARGDYDREDTLNWIKSELDGFIQSEKNITPNEKDLTTKFSASEVAKRITNKEFHELNATDKMCYLMINYGEIPGDQIFGDTNNPSSLSAENIPDDEEKLFMTKNFVNGITSLRPLRNKGLLYKKDQANYKLTFFGFGDPKIYHDAPVSVEIYFQSIVDKGDVKCNHCNAVVLGGTLYQGPNWHIDHRFSLTPEKYGDYAFRHNNDNWQLLCLSCSSKNREFEKKIAAQEIRNDNEV